MTHHRLPASPETTVQEFDRGHAGVLSVEPGDRLTVDSLDAVGFLRRPAAPGEQPPQMFADRRGHCLTGPVRVRGAEPGDVLAVGLHDIVPGGWGWTQAGGWSTPVNDRLEVAGGGPAHLLWDLDVPAGTATESRGFVRSLAPFLGVVGVAPAEPGPHSTTPPRPGSGGNIDCRDLVAGSTLYLPVQVPGALLYLGDGHAAQGDGEVGGTAIECPMTTTLTVEVLKPGADGSGGPVLPGIHAETPTGFYTFGFATDLDTAMGDALSAMTTWLQARHDLDRPTALALAGTCVDLRITQVVNQTWGVHAVLPTGVLRRA